jgi:hypothetical protein
MLLKTPEYILRRAKKVFQIAEPFHLASTTTPAGWWCFDPRILVLYKPAKWQSSLDLSIGLERSLSLRYLSHPLQMLLLPALDSCLVRWQ